MLLSKWVKRAVQLFMALALFGMVLGIYVSMKYPNYSGPLIVTSFACVGIYYFGLWATDEHNYWSRVLMASKFPQGSWRRKLPFLLNWLFPYPKAVQKN